jgi:hypothetical protein
VRLFPLLVASASLLLQGCKGCSDQSVTPIPEVPPAEPPRDIGRWLSMAVTPDGKPAIAYYDVAADALGYAVGTVAQDGSVTWAKEPVDSFPDANGLNPGDAGKYASLAFDGAGKPWIAYQDSTNGTLKYATREGDAWKVGVADTGGGPRSDAGYWASLAIAPDGTPWIAHHDKGQGSLRVARWSGSSFAGEVVYDGEDVTTGAGTTPGSAGAYARLRFAPDGTAYVAFQDAALTALKLATKGSAGWSVELVDDAGDVGTWPDLAFDGGNVSIAYADRTEGDLKLATGRPGAWSTAVVDNGDTVGEDVAFLPDAAGLVYFDGVNADMKLARRSGSAWVVETVTGADAARGFHNEAVNIGGTPHVACYDFTSKSIWFSRLPS